MTENLMGRWLFLIKVADHPGVLVRVASVFSNRGVSLEGILGHGAEFGEEGVLIFVFTSTKKKRDTLRRTINRLESVLAVDYYSYENPFLRKATLATVRAERGEIEKITKRYPLIHETVRVGDGYVTFLLIGLPGLVDETLEGMAASGILSQSVSSIVAL